MNTRPQFLLALPLFLACAFAQDAPPTAGDDPFRKAPQTVPRLSKASTLPPLKLVFETYTLDATLAREVLVKDGPVKAYARAKELAQAGQAKFAQSVAVVTSSGHRVLNEEIREIRYPSQWAAPKLTLPKEKSKSAPAKPKSKQPTAGGEEQAGPPRDVEAIWIEDPTPTAFETRNVGITIEVDPSRRGAFCDAPIAINITRHLGDREVAPGTKFIQPTFEIRRFSINSAFPLGVPSFLGTLNGPVETGVPEQDNRQPATIVFATATGDAPPNPEASGELPPGTFTAVIEVYSMPPEKALAASKEMGPAAIDRTLAFVAEGGARLEEIFAVRGIAGANVRTGTLQEFKYATEWAPAALSPAEAKRWPQVPAIFSLPFPSAVDTRNIGTEAEFLAKPDQDGSWMTETKVEAVLLVRQREIPAGSHIIHPTFETRKIMASMRVAVGRPTLLGSFSALPVEEENARGKFAPLAARIAEPRERERAWLAFITIHGAAVEPPAKPVEVAKASNPREAGTTAVPGIQPPFVTGPVAEPIPSVSVAPAPAEELITEYFDFSQPEVEKFRKSNLKDYLTKADVPFPPGSQISVIGNVLFVRTTREGVARVGAIFDLKPSTELSFFQWTDTGDLIDAQLLEEVERPEHLTDPIPAKVWSCKKQLQQLGVSFPEGSYAIYLRNSKRLFFWNTRKNGDRANDLMTSVDQRVKKF